MNRFLVVIILILTFGTINAYADAQLDQLTQKITRMQKQMQQTQSKRADHWKELKDIETKVGSLSQQLQKARQDLITQRDKLNELNKIATEHQAILKLQQDLLSKQIQATYKQGQHSHIKLLLSQNNPAQVSRMLSYYQHMSLARAAILKNTQLSLKNTLDAKQQMQQQTQHLQELLNQAEKTQKQLIATQRNRRQVIKKLDSEIKSKEEILQQLQQNKIALEDVVQNIQKETKSNTNLAPQATASAQSSFFSKSFSRMQQQLPWPTQGEILPLFGTAIEQSKLIHNGIIIQAPLGQPVRAIHSGRVVFANWMRGFGLLMIIDHNEGFMSLYAHNHSFYKKQGDQVRTGELIATVGNSGGNKKESLYFEIRRDGKPLDPLKWCLAVGNAKANIKRRT